MNVNAGWRQDANCRGLSPSLFFPERGESTKHAMAVCAACTVAAECLAYGLTLRGREGAGIWGGTTERQRRNIRRESLSAA